MINPPFEESLNYLGALKKDTPFKIVVDGREGPVWEVSTKIYWDLITALTFQVFLNGEWTTILKFPFTLGEEMFVRWSEYPDE